MSEDRTMKRNLIRAACLIVCGTAALCGIGALLDASTSTVGPSYPGTPQITLKDVFAGHGDGDDSDRLPQGFEEELFPLDAFYDVRVSGKGGVIGLLSHDPAREVLGFCEAELFKRGWTRVESGHEACASFVRAQGAYTWLFMGYTEVNGDTSLIVSPA